MEHINLNSILSREEIATELKERLVELEENKNDLTYTRGFYVYGRSGVGKTSFVTNILKELDYSIIYYDAGDVRNKDSINKITRHNIATNTVYSMFHKKKKKIAVLMDEIDGMNNGDKGGLNSLIKLIRPKKTKRQKQESYTMVPVICIGDNFKDKKIKELIKVCHTYNLEEPTLEQTEEIIGLLFKNIPSTLHHNMVEFVNNDLQKINTLYSIYVKNKDIIKNSTIKGVFKSSHTNKESKLLTRHVLTNKIDFDSHYSLINETDRTSLALLFHENIIDVLPKQFTQDNIKFYLTFLENFCYVDYIDRITFQKQIWIFNEISSLLKTAYNNNILHDKYTNIQFSNKKDVRFTKVLTKYSTEYNNNTFVQTLCMKLNMDKSDLMSFFIELSQTYETKQIIELLEHLEISRLDVNRIYKYIDSVYGEYK